MIEPARRLCVEHLDEPTPVVGTHRPRLSWQLPVGATTQVGYQLDIDGTVMAAEARGTSTGS